MRNDRYISAIVSAIGVLLLFCIIVLPACAAHGAGSHSGPAQGGMGNGVSARTQHENGAAHADNALRDNSALTASLPKNSRGNAPGVAGNSAGSQNAGPALMKAHLWGTGTLTSPPGNGGTAPVRRAVPRNGHPSSPWHGVPLPVQDRYPCGPAQATDTLPAQGCTAPPLSAPHGNPRTRRMEGDAVENESDGYSIPAPILPALGYKRINKKNILESAARNRVYSAIAENPGMDAPSLAEYVGMNVNTLRYHLFALAREEKITFFSRPGTVRYFVNSGLYPPSTQCFYHYLRGATTRKIILLLDKHPGMTRGELAADLGITGPSVTRHIRDLSCDGIVEARAEGRSSHHYLTVPALSLLGALEGGPVQTCLARKGTLEYHVFSMSGPHAET